VELVAINLARVAAFLEILALDPKGQTTAPEGLRSFAERYSFVKFPQTAAEMDFQKGVQFAAGRFKDIAIDQVQLYNNGIAIDTRSSTDSSLRILQDILEFTKVRTGASVAPVREHFISHIAFRSTLKLALLNPILQPIADRLAEQSSKQLNHPIVFEPTLFTIGPDTSQIKIAPAIFSIERRIETPFNENTYFSVAPLSTADHLKLIAEVEAALQK
jgi:hypothetical protein